MARAIAAALGVEPMPDGLAGRLLSRLEPQATEVVPPARGPAPILWLVPLGLSGAATVLLTAALWLGLPLGAVLAALGAGVLATAAVLAELSRLTLLPSALAAAFVSAVLFPRVARMEVRER